MKDVILTQLEAELTAAEAKTDSLRQQVAARRAFLGGPVLVAKERKAKPGKRAKAPAGLLGDAITKAIGGAPEGLTKKQVGAALAAGGYGFSVSAAHISRKLGKMKAAGEVRIEKRDQVNVYRLPA